MSTARRIAVVLASLGLVVAGAAVVQAAATHESADCVGGPITHAGSSSEFDVHCTVPNTQTTVTEPGPTVTVPGPTATVTATETVTMSPSPTAPTTTPTTEPPAEQGTWYGACPESGGTSAAAAASVPAKFGGPAYIRQFNGTSNPVTWNAVPAGSLMHRSYKPPTTITDAAIDSLLNAARGHMVTFWHESDNDGLSSTARAARIALMNRLYDRNVALGRPALIVPTFTGGMFADYGTEANRDLWAGVKGDLLGVDYDGVHSYGTEYDDETLEVLEWLDENPEYTGWAIPEFGTSRQSSDPSGNGRAAWISEQLGYFEAADPQPVAVAWYDYDSTPQNSIQPGSPEFAIWEDLVAGNP